MEEKIKELETRVSLLERTVLALQQEVCAARRSPSDDEPRCWVECSKCEGDGSIYKYVGKEAEGEDTLERASTP